MAIIVSIRKDSSALTLGASDLLALSALIKEKLGQGGPDDEKDGVLSVVPSVRG